MARAGNSSEGTSSQQSRSKVNGNHRTPASLSAKTSSLPVGNDQLIRAYSEMVCARTNDEKAIILYKQNKCHFQIGVAGHEAVEVAAGHIFRPSVDWFYPYYRDMALCVSLGMTSRELMLNAMNKKDDPNSHGRQMPMHYGHSKLHIINQSSPTGTQFLQAVGCAKASQLRKDGTVVYVSAGEGACAQGDFHEALNWAAREKLPMIFLIENNDYAISVHISEQIAGQSVYKLAAGYENLARHEIDGTDYLLSHATISTAYQRAQKGEGPTLIEAHVPRMQSHSISDNQAKYRSSEELATAQAQCPIVRMRALLIEHGVATPEELKAIDTTIKKEVDEAAEWADAQPDPAPSDALTFNYADESPWLQAVPDGQHELPPTGPETYLVDAINHALDEEMAKNPEMYIFGQDVAHGKGGVFAVTSGLTSKYGAERVFNAQLAESSIIGVAIGMASVGLRPVVEVQFGDYIWTGMMQLRNELAMMYYRSAGETASPAVIRVPVGGYIHGGCYHSQNIEATLAHFPGLYVIYPSNATDAKGLLKSAIRGKDPVLFLEHKGLYRQVYAKGPEGDKDYLLPIGKARLAREGQDVTVVTWGALVNKSLVAARELEKEGVSVEVIDLRTIVPFDREAVFQSVRKTGRVLVAHEDLLFMGFGAEVASQISENCFTSLDAPVRRLGMKYVAAVPHSKILEQAVLPQNEDILEALRSLLSF